MSKSAYWAERFRQEGWRPAWTAADALWLDMRQTRPDYPTPADRETDLACHVKLCADLTQAAYAFTGR